MRLEHAAAPCCTRYPQLLASLGAADDPGLIQVCISICDMRRAATSAPVASTTVTLLAAGSSMKCPAARTMHPRAPRVTAAISARSARNASAASGVCSSDGPPSSSAPSSCAACASQGWSPAVCGMHQSDTTLACECEEWFPEDYPSFGKVASVNCIDHAIIIHESATDPGDLMLLKVCTPYLFRHR